jgi:hypothetical protein
MSSFIHFFTRQSRCRFGAIGKGTFFIYLFLAPLLALRAEIAAPVNNTSSAAPPLTEMVSLKKAKPGFFKRPLAKMLLRRIEKARHGNDYSTGAWLAVFGLLCVPLIVVSWFLSPYLGLIVTIPFSLLGLGLSIWAATKAFRRRTFTKWVQIVSVAGIILNGLLGLTLIMALIFYSS